MAGASALAQSARRALYGGSLGPRLTASPTTAPLARASARDLPLVATSAEGPALRSPGGANSLGSVLPSGRARVNMPSPAAWGLMQTAPPVAARRRNPSTIAGLIRS